LGFLNNGAPVGPMVYGGVLFTVPNPEIAYAASGTKLFLRTKAAQQGGTFAQTNYPGSTVKAIALDPDNWHRAFVLDTLGNLWRTTDAGVTWDNQLSGDLSQLARSSPFSPVDVRTLAIYSPTQ